MNESTLVPREELSDLDWLATAGKNQWAYNLEVGQ